MVYARSIFLRGDPVRASGRWKGRSGGHRSHRGRGLRRCLCPIPCPGTLLGGCPVLNHLCLVIIIALESKILISGGIVNTIRARVAFLTTIVYFYIHNKKYVYEEGIYCGTVCNASDWTFFLRQRRHYGCEGEAGSCSGVHSV